MQLSPVSFTRKGFSAPFDPAWHAMWLQVTKQICSAIVNIGRMSVEPVPGSAESTFRQHLNSAIISGERPPRDAGLGSGTCDAIDLVATNHPEADVRLIADAYDAFAREHGAVMEATERSEPDPSPAAPRQHPLVRKRRFRIR